MWPCNPTAAPCICLVRRVVGRVVESWGTRRMVVGDICCIILEECAATVTKKAVFDTASGVVEGGMFLFDRFCVAASLL